MSPALRAVAPARIASVWNALALRQLCDLVSQQAEELEQLRARLAQVEDDADFWHEEAMRMQEELAEATGQERGITIEGHLVMAPTAQAVSP